MRRHYTGLLTKGTESFLLSEARCIMPNPRTRTIGANASFTACPDTRTGRKLERRLPDRQTVTMWIIIAL